MAFLRRMTAEREEMILAGAVPAGDSDIEVADFVMALRAALPARAPDEVTAVTVPRLAQAARIGALEADAPTRDPGGAAAAGTAPASATLGRPRHRLALVARIAVAVALLPLLTAGLAVAGVRLPDAAVDGFDSVGVDLPNQAAPDESNGTGGSAGDEDRAGDSGEATSESGTAGRANADEKRGVGNGEGQGKVPSHAGDGGRPSHSNAGGNGGGAGNGPPANPNGPPVNPNGPPANSNTGGNKAGSSGGQGSAVEDRGAKPAVPPGQAHRPADPGNSRSVRGQLEVEDE